MSITDRLAQINGKSQGQIPRLVGRAESSLSIRERSPGLDLSLSEEPNRQQEDTYHFIIRITHKNYVHVRTLQRLNTQKSYPIRTQARPFTTTTYHTRAARTSARFDGSRQKREAAHTSVRFDSSAPKRTSAARQLPPRTWRAGKNAFPLAGEILEMRLLNCAYLLNV